MRLTFAGEGLSGRQGSPWTLPTRRAREIDRQAGRDGGRRYANWEVVTRTWVVATGRGESGWRLRRGFGGQARPGAEEGAGGRGRTARGTLGRGAWGGHSQDTKGRFRLLALACVASPPWGQVWLLLYDTGLATPPTPSPRWPGAWRNGNRWCPGLTPWTLFLPSRPGQTPPPSPNSAPSISQDSRHNMELGSKKHSKTHLLLSPV